MLQSWPKKLLFSINTHDSVTLEIYVKDITLIGRSNFLYRRNTSGIMLEDPARVPNAKLILPLSYRCCFLCRFSGHTHCSAPQSPLW